MKRFFLLVIALVWLTFNLSACTASRPSGPKLSVQQLEHDLGVVAFEAGEVEDTFYLRNAGGKPLVLQSIDPACGCTTAEPEKEVLAPGETTPLKVLLDTRLKLGPVRKTIDITTNDPEQPVTQLVLLADVVASELEGHHGMALDFGNRLALFEGNCRSCHVDRGIGKTGQALFVADCAMCHGVDAKGGVAPGLLNGDYSLPSFKAYMRDVIANGAKQNPSMPPFAESQGGPLTESQIDSLVQYLSYLASQQGATTQ